MRAEVGLPSVQLDPVLCDVAKYRTDDMGQNKYFSHYRRSVSAPEIRYLRNEFQLSKEATIAENIAYTTASVDIGNRFSDNWRKSKGHYKNIIDSRWTKIGIAVHKFDGGWYGTQIFTN